MRVCNAWIYNCAVYIAVLDCVQCQVLVPVLSSSNGLRSTNSIQKV